MRKKLHSLPNVRAVQLLMHTLKSGLRPWYAHATWHRLLPFFRLPGRVTEEKQTVWVERFPFNDRQLNRDLQAVCQRVTVAQLHLPDERRLCFTTAGMECQRIRWSMQGVGPLQCLRIKYENHLRQAGLSMFALLVQDAYGCWWPILLFIWWC